MKRQTENKELFTIKCKINGIEEVIYFLAFTIESKRSEFVIEQTYGLDVDGCLSKDFTAFTEGSTEQLILDFVKFGDVRPLVNSGVVLFERPEKGEISRNIAIFDQRTGYSYTVGGIGLISATENPSHFILSDPLIDQEYGEYQKRKGNQVGGIHYFSEKGMKAEENSSVVGVFEYDTGPYNIIKKMHESERIKKLGINSPTYIAGGVIKNFGDSRFGFTIYRNYLTPEYLPNIGLYVDNRGSFKPHLKTYIDSKYSQLYLLHTKIKESHGQPSVTNTLAEIDITKTDDNLRCQIKDFQTNKPIPKNKKKIILDGLSPTPTGWLVKKSPHSAAQLYDLQLAILQDFNVVNCLQRQITNLQDRFNFITNGCAQMLMLVNKAYPICSEPECSEAINFAMRCFYEHLQRTDDFSQFNFVISGAFSHRAFSNSRKFHDQVELIFRQEAIPKTAVDAYAASRGN